LRASNSRSPPTRHTSSESTWEERKKEKKKKKTVENRVHPIINFHILLHFPSSFAFIYIFIYLKKRNPFFFGHRFTPPGNQLKTCWYGYKILKLHGKSFFHPCEKPKKKKRKENRELKIKYKSLFSLGRRWSANRSPFSNPTARQNCAFPSSNYLAANNNIFTQSENAVL
jgi:hypothetical protein